MSHGQDRAAWRRHLVQEITQQSRRENNLKVRDTANVIAVPVCFYSCPGAEILQSAKTCKPSIDSFAAYGVLLKDNLVKGIAQNTGKKRYGFYSLLELQRLNRKGSEDTTWSMIKMARARSNDFYFVYFLPVERNRYGLIAFVEKGQTKYITRQFKVYHSIRQLINEHYKPAAEFIHKMDELLIKTLLKKNLGFDEARRITANDYIQYTQQHPEDSSGVMQRLLKELGEQLQLADTTKQRLALTITQRFYQVPLFKDRRYTLKVAYYDRNIFSILREFAPIEKLHAYLEFRRMRNWLIQKAYEKLSREDENLQ